MSRKSLASALFLACGLLAPAVQAQVEGVRLTVSPYVGFTLWDQLVKLDENPVYGGRIGLWFNNHLGIEGTYGFCPTEATRTDGSVDYHHIGGDLLINLTGPHRVVPYIGGGYSRQMFDPVWDHTPPDATGKQTFDGWEAVAGIKAALSDRWWFRLDARDVMAQIDQPLTGNDNWTHNFIFSGGLDIVLGGHVADEDGDGVSNRKDKCAGTPLGAVVDKNGCPVDSDGDGVADGIDQCSNTQAGVRVDAKGCPMDSDGDGVSDGVDLCASTPVGAKVDAKGCPLDGDGDGVADGIDQCANTPTSARVDARGCPTDSDGDGVPDGIDQCANTPPNSRVDARGCELSDREQQILDTGLIRLENVNFATGKAVLTPESHAVLDKVGELMTKWPMIKVEIGGHTDSRGSATANETLSQSRAEAVRQYIVSKFPNLDPNQYTAKGYGESQAIADNNTELGRSKNRRVELKILNKEVLKQEWERRQQR